MLDPSQSSVPSLDVDDPWLIRGKEALVRALIWAFIGALYGMLFVAFLMLSDVWGVPIPSVLFASMSSGAVAALIYSSMRLSVIIAALMSIFSVAYLIVRDADVHSNNFVIHCLALGAFIGALFGRFAKTSQVYMADAKILSGLVAGTLTGLTYLVAEWLWNVPESGWMIAAMCPLTGWIYVFLVPIFVPRFSWLLPTMVDGAVVGAGASMFVGLCVWVMAGSIDTAVVGSAALVVKRILAEFPTAIAGGIIGGFVAGFVSGAIGLEWQDQ